MPAVSRLMQRGGLYPLETTVSPESPTAWASFATGVNPGKHNIYDFLVRDTNTYLPDLGMVRREPPSFLFNWIPIKRPKVISIRGGTSFWVTSGAAGIRSSILTVPITFPPEDVPNGELLSGLPLPDIRGTMGTFSYFATDLSRYEEGNTEFGGILRRLSFDGNTARTELVGPPNPIIRTKIQAIRHKGPLVDVILGVEYQHFDVRPQRAFTDTVVLGAPNTFDLDAKGDIVRARLTIKTAGYRWFY